MLNYFIIALSFVFLIVSMIQLSKWIYGETSTHNGIIAIIACIGSLSYLVYFFSESNAESRNTTLSELLTPVSMLGQNAADAALNGAERAVVVRGSRHFANFMNLPSLAGAITTGAYFYSVTKLPLVLSTLNTATTYFFSSPMAPVVPLVIAIFSGILSFLTGHLHSGGRRSMKRA